MLRALIDGMVSLVMSLDDGEPPPLQERREQVRLRCHYPVKVNSGGSTFRSVVTDVGPRGLRLKFVNPMRKGSVTTITYDHEESGRPPVQCRTVWCRKRRFSPDRIAGVEFTGGLEAVTGSWVGQVLEELGFSGNDEGGNPRRWVRADTHFPARLQLKGGPELEARVVNLGVGGAQLLSDHASAEPGTPALLKMGPYEGLPELEMEAQLLSVAPDELIDGALWRLRFEHTDPIRVEALGKYVLHMLREKHL